MMNVLTKILETLVGNRIDRPEIRELYLEDHPEEAESSEKKGKGRGRKS